MFEAFVLCHNKERRICNPAGPRHGGHTRGHRREMEPKLSVLVRGERRNIHLSLFIYLLKMAQAQNQISDLKKAKKGGVCCLK